MKKIFYNLIVNRPGDQDVGISMSVKMVTGKIRNDMDDRGIIIYGYKFRPCLPVCGKFQ